MAVKDYVKQENENQEIVAKTYNKAGVFTWHLFDEEVKSA